ncbi:MAG: hypothetical protein KAT43_04625 [Nanoarchaeota archaeon]|nr:hypothetical protein [Nanoarchaeota archaeon]
MTNEQLAKRVNDFIKKNMTYENMYIKHDYADDCDQSTLVGRQDSRNFQGFCRPDPRVSEEEKKKTIENGVPLGLYFRFIAISGEDVWFDKGMHMRIDYELTKPDKTTSNTSFLYEGAVTRCIIDNAPEDLAENLRDALNKASTEACAKITQRWKR